MTLQDEITETEETADTPGPAPVDKAERTRVSLDAATGLLTVQNGAGVRTYSLAGIPEPVRAHLALVCLQTSLLRTKDPVATMARMQAGQLPGRTPGKPREINPWRLAYAHAKVEATKRTEAPMSLEDAKAAAAALPTGKLREAKVHPLVVKHYAKLTGASAELV